MTNSVCRPIKRVSDAGVGGAVRYVPALSACRSALDPAAAEQAVSGVADGRLAGRNRAG
jgi:hypothetical protein